jgi:hypothetical protein
VRVAELIEEFVAKRPNDTIRRGGETFLSVDAVRDLIEEAARRGVKVLGLEAFVISDATVYPALSRIADLSAASASDAADEAKRLLEGAWATAPTTEDQLHSDASGRYMLAVVLDQT